MYRYHVREYILGEVVLINKAVAKERKKKLRYMYL
jgi:hypothetical protein